MFVITKGNWGGAQRYVFDIASSLPKSKFNPVVVFGEGDRLETKLKEISVRTVKIPSLGRDINLVQDFKVIVDLVNLFKKEQPDIIHLNSSKIGILGAIAGRLAKVPKIIFTGHGWAWNENRFVLSKIIIGFAHWLTILLCHQVIAVSEKTKRQITRLPFVSYGKIPVIYNGIDQIEHMERFQARNTIAPHVSEKFWIGTIAELHINKGLDILIQSFADLVPHHQDITLVIIGEGEERKKLEEKIKELNLENKVHLIGFVENSAKFLKAFDVFILPSRTEAFPYVILEAGQAQLPVVASKVGGIPEVINNQENGILVKPGNSREISRFLERLLDNSAEAAELGHNLRKTIEESFSRQGMVEKTIAVYNK